MSTGTPRVTFGTASAPVSRHASRNEGETAAQPGLDDVSPLSSGRTAHDGGDFMGSIPGGEGPRMYHTAATGGGSGGDGLVGGGGGDIGDATHPSHLTRAAALGSMSAPASPHGIDEAGRTGFPLSNQESATDTLAPPTVAGGNELSHQKSEPLSGRPSAKRGGSFGEASDGIRRRDHHRHNHHSGRSTPASYTGPYFDPYSPYSRSFEGRPLSHQARFHKQPVYSLARPLPTKEQRDAQKAYRREIRNRLDAKQSGGAIGSVPTSRASSRASFHHPSAPLVGPGALHHGGVPGGYPAVPLYPTHSYRGAGSLNNRPDKEELMGMLRELLNEGEGKGNREGVTEVREDGIDAVGKGGTKAEVARTHRAERHDSLSSSSSCSSDHLEDEEESFPNPWARFRHTMREPFAEFLGTMILIIFGTGVSLQYFLSLDENIAPNPRGTYLSVSFGWGIGVGMGVWVAGGISGGHINPAVTVALALFRGFPWRKVPGYVIAQILGSMAGGGLNYALYRRAITIYESGARTVTGPTATASLFATYPLTYVTDANAFFQEFVDSAILLIVVLAISDTNNASPPDGLNPLVLFLLITGIGAALGMQTAYCINPARDLGPRLVTWFAGYGREVWNFRNQYWLWTPVCATMSGAIFGALIYDTLIYTGAESPCNIKWSFLRKKKGASFAPASKEKMPAGQIEA